MWRRSTRTEDNATPIFIYNANPLNCIPSVGSSTPVSPGGGGGGGRGWRRWRSEEAAVAAAGGGGVLAQPADCDTAELQFSSACRRGSQRDVADRSDRGPHGKRFSRHAQPDQRSSSPITDLQVNINAGGYQRRSRHERVFHPDRRSCSVSTRLTARVRWRRARAGRPKWTIIPTTNAAPDGATDYGIGGTISYTYDGEQVTIPLFPVTDHGVAGTTLVSGLLPATRRLQPGSVYQRVRTADSVRAGAARANLGHGVANDFTITSAQPTIINNANGLLINFEIISSDVGTNTTSRAFADLGYGRHRSRHQCRWAFGG